MIQLQGMVNSKFCEVDALTSISILYEIIGYNLFLIFNSKQLMGLIDVRLISRTRKIQATEKSIGGE